MSGGPGECAEWHRIHSQVEVVALSNVGFKLELEPVVVAPKGMKLKKTLDPGLGAPPEMALHWPPEMASHWAIEPFETG